MKYAIEFDQCMQYIEDIFVNCQFFSFNELSVGNLPINVHNNYIV